ncbi:MAG: hypothetical protein LLG37_01820 [Spirochaetia bacterium]|nr:hypothetical protein [Spirochaetia bacterium]
MKPLEKNQVEAGLAGLKHQRDREIMMLRYGIGGGEHMTMEAIGARYNITRERVRQVINRAARILSHPKYKTSNIPE